MMANIDKIRGSSVLKLFRRLQQDVIPLKMHLMSGEYERLTHIAEVRKWKKAHYFLIEYHENFRRAADGLGDPRLRFEFSGKDNINYNFETGFDQISQKMIWARLPEIVNRYQRRGHFRLEAPHGTRLCSKINDQPYDLLVINISLGGTLGVLSTLTIKMERELREKSPEILKNVELIFPYDNDNEDSEDSKVNIKHCKVIRQRRNPATQRYEFAIEFKEMTEDQQKKLTTLFYQWQREYLKKRRQFKV
jgi:c-di-GMP-binding flagellar brake protein YcgR